MHHTTGLETQRTPHRDRTRDDEPAHDGRAIGRAPGRLEAVDAREAFAAEHNLRNGFSSGAKAILDLREAFSSGANTVLDLRNALASGANAILDPQRPSRYARTVRSKISKQLDEEMLAQVLSMSIEERVALAFALGDEAVRAYAFAHHVSLASARQALREAREAERPRRPRKI